MGQPDSDSDDAKPTALDEAVPSEDEFEPFQSILDQTQWIILQQILAHDSGVLSRVELEARNPDMNQSTIRSHLDTLVEHEVLTKVEASENSRELPSVFYAVSERGISLLKQVNLYDEIGVWNQVYSQVPTPDNLAKIEELERPVPDWYESNA